MSARELQRQPPGMGPSAKKLPVTEEEEEAGGGEGGGMAMHDLMGMQRDESVEAVDEAFAKWVHTLRPLITNEGDEIRNLIGAMKGVSILVHMCQSCQDDDVVDDCIVVLHDLCSSPVALEELVVLGGLQVCVDILLDEERKDWVHLHMLMLLVRVVVTPDVKLSVMELGAAPAIIRLVTHSDTSIVKRALTLLVHCSTEEQNIEYFQSLGSMLIEPLLLLCENDFDSVVLGLATELLDKLVRSDSQREIFVKLNAVSALLRVLSHSLDPRPKEHAMSVLRLLCMDPTIRRGIIEKGGLAPLVQATHHGETMEIRKHAGVVLAEISLSDAMAPQLEMLEGGKVFAHLEKNKKKK